MPRFPLLFLILGILALDLRAQNPALTTYGNSTALFSLGIKVAPGSRLYFTSGTSSEGEGGSDLKAQALAAFAKLKGNLSAAGFGLGDVVLGRAYLAPGANGKIDYDGWNAAWSATFGNSALNHKPDRTTIGVPRLVRSGALVEIELVCAAPGLPARADGPSVQSYGPKESRISAGVAVQGAGLYWTNGIAADKKVGNDTRSQSEAAFGRIKESLAQAGLGLKDVISLHAFLGPDPTGHGAFDLDGWNAAYDEFFNTAANPHKPARSTVTAPAMPVPGARVEIEALAAIRVHSPKRTGWFFGSGIAGATEGDVKAEALSALGILKSRLAEAGLGLKDVAFLRCYLQPGADGTLDRQAWNDAFGTFFKTAENHPPFPRSTVAVVSVPNPKRRLEIDAIAVAP